MKTVAMGSEALECIRKCFRDDIREIMLHYFRGEPQFPYSIHRKEQVEHSSEHFFLCFALCALNDLSK